MSSKTLRFLSKLLCIALIASIAFEAPVMAATTNVASSINVNVGGQNVQVTPGQWVAVKQGTQVTHYNVRYVDGKPVALDMAQYTKLIFGGSSANVPAAPAATTQTSAAQTPAATTGKVTTPSTSGSTASNWDAAAHPRDPVTGRFVSTNQGSAQAPAVSNSGTVANNAPTTGAQAPAAPVDASVAAAPAAADTNVSGAAQSGSKGSSGSWIKDEISGYGKSIKDNFTTGKQNGQEFGTKTYDGAKEGISKVGDTVKTTGSKIGDMLRGAKDRIAKIFHKNPAPKTDGAQSGQTGQTGQSGDPDGPGQTGQSGQSGQGNQNGQSGQSGQGNQGQTSQSGQSTDPDGPGQTGQTGQGNQGQSGQSGQGNQGQPGQNGDPDGAQPGQTGQSGQSGQGNQGDPDGPAAPAKPGIKEVTGTKFKSGYEAGKAMTNQGFQNVKDSLKSGFSGKNLLMTAGITVGVDLATSIMRGEKPSVKKALKTVCSAEFAGGVVGSVTGAAAGSFFVPFLSAIPVVGGVMSALAPTFGSIVGGSVGAYLAGDLKNGRFSIREAFKKVDWIGVAGQTVGSTAGALLGSFLGPVGTIIGGMVGGYLGNWAAHKIAALFGKDNGAGSGLGTIAMPVGSNPLGQSAGDGSVTIGAVAGSEIPVSGDQVQAPALTITGEAETIGSYASEVQLAYAKYQELYKLYNEMLAQGRQEDAMKVASEMNKAKAEYDALKAQASK